MSLTAPDTSPPSSLAHSKSKQGLRQLSRDAATPPLPDEPSRRVNGEDDAGVDISPVSIMDGIEDWASLDKIPATSSEDTGTQKQVLENTEYFSQDASQGDSDCDTSVARSNKPFYKWMRTLHKRAIRRQELLDGVRDPMPYGLDVDGGSSITGSFHHRQSSSGSSFGFVTAVKSASVSLTSASVLTRSRRHTHLSSRGHSRTDRSSRASVSGARLSEDSFCLDRQVTLDPAVMERSLQRRRILEELISTEESYIGDVRFLMNVYVTILASLPTLPPGLRSSINRNLTDIVELHEEMLGDLHRAVPDSEYTQLELPPPISPVGPGGRGHQRWRSLDAVPEDKDGITWLQEMPGMISEPQTAAEVAKIFSKKMNRFFIYEEYGAKYELMIKDVASAHRTMPKWQSYQKGLEVLAASLESVNSQDDRSKKSLTIGDLLVKPIQRVCKYPLLFAELLKHTPVVDCPYSHMEIENTLIRLREATAEINRATDDARIKSVLEKTWILQDRLVFPNQQLDAASKNRVRSFGHLQLCGALHVCWQTKEGVSGQYMVALLYREWLCLATASRIDQIYTIQACIALNNIKLEEVDNGRGLQCHTAPYSWKLVFICDHQLYEVILTACTPREENEWRTRLSFHQTVNSQEQMQSATFSSLSLNIKTLGTVFRKPGTIARRISIHRATTVGPKSPLCQVILKNTSVIKDAPSSGSGTGSQINRSQSLLTTTARIPVIAPSRGERARLEALLSDVWTRDILPFPGITARSRSEHLVRASASSVMRKLSVVSITSSFSKRSASLASLQQKASAEDEARAHQEVAPSTTITAEKSEDAGRSLLSVIPDETERGTPSLQGTFRDRGGEVAGAVCRGGATTTWESTDSEAVCPMTPALRHASGNSSMSLSLQESSFSRPSTRGSIEKENVYSPSPQGSAKGRPHRLSSRLAAKVGVLHREAVVQSIRNLFR
ncbi:hypothetical protein B0T25DRAFT_350820 [Lasiosphaeria hispida]|uniref:DH domain-containing protein n=1 Tax=Lasiosphaeria hispida TaxID=260671 RepID=A0AAJ0M8I8_9PEZI|nr:hypothetical protein B0T25DRAFT_350820 [Lasiosphaeria hispida]